MQDQLEDIILMLVGEKEARFPPELAIKLFQLQTWVYFPEPQQKLWEVAGIMAACKWIEHYERQLEETDTSIPSRSDPEFVDVTFRNRNSRRLYNKFIADQGTWIRLLRAPPPGDFDALVDKREDSSVAVAQMIAYRFRYLDHGGSDTNLANISRGMAFVYPDFSGKTLRARWAENKPTAAFVYIDQRFKLNFRPRRIDDDDFVSDLTEEVKCPNYFRNYFGQVKYVTEVLQHAGFKDQRCSFPSSLPAIRPVTDPLTPEGILSPEKYKEIAKEIRDN